MIAAAELRSRHAAVAGAGVALALLARVAAGSQAPHRSLLLIAGSVAVAVLEEWLFRGALYRALERRSVWLAITGSALAFAAVHLPVYGPGGAAVDLVAGLVLGAQRAVTDGWAVSAVTHAVADVLALL